MIKTETISSKKLSRNFWAFLTVLVLVPVVLVIGVVMWYQRALTPASSDTTKQSFEIKAGESGAEIANDLKNSGLIRNALAFRIYAKKQGLSERFAEGVYYLSPSMDVEIISNQLLHGEADVRITTIEGWRNEEIAQRLHDVMNIDQKAFLAQAKQGYMFPDTYLFNKKEAIPDIVMTMENNFTTKVSDQIDRSSVILASIVEREARDSVPNERQMIASILLKRLKLGMPLQVDATVQYALGYDTIQKKWWRELSEDELQTPSPYNTYLHAGLPPEPICNPGLASIQAAQKADQNTPYLYYLHDKNGMVHFERTLDEHNADRQKYL